MYRRIIGLVGLIVLLSVTTAYANVLSSQGRACFSDQDNDGFSETIVFPGLDHALSGIDPSDPLLDYVGMDSVCNLPKSYIEMPSIALTGELGYTPSPGACENGELPFVEATYPASYHLYLLDGSCQYYDALQMDIVVEDAAMANWCPESRFAFEFFNAVIDNRIGSSLLDYFASQPDWPPSWATVDLSDAQIADFGALVKSGQAFCADAALNLLPGVVCRGCDDCGVESNGRMADAMAKRHYLRGLSAVCSDPSGEGVLCDRPLAFEEPSETSELPSLPELLPDFESLGLQAVPTTPNDLVEITNARDVVAVDHFRQSLPNGAILLIETRDSVYEHTKSVCDRAAGDVMEHISVVHLRDMAFPIAVIYNSKQDKRSFVASFAIADNKIFARWRLEEYPSFPGEVVYNAQVWSCSPRELRNLLEAQLTRVEEVFGAVEFDTDFRFSPKAYITRADKYSSTINLNIKGKKDGQMMIQGQYWPEADPKNAVEFSVAMPEDGRLSETLPPFIDAQVGLIGKDGQKYDEVYITDGTFTAFDDRELADGESKTTTMINSACTRSVSDNEDDLMVTGCGRISGSVDKYAVVTRPLGGVSSPFDLSEFGSISFDYNSTTRSVFCLESVSRYGKPQSCINLPQTEEWTRAIINLKDISIYQKPGEHAVLDDIVALSWNIWRSGDLQKLDAVELDVRDVTLHAKASLSPTLGVSALDGDIKYSGGCKQPGSASALLLILLGLVAISYRRRLQA